MIQLFDSWAGALSVSAYEAMVLPYSRRILEAVAETGVPTIHFGTTTAHLLEAMARCGSDVISVDWRLPLDEAWRRIGDRGIQGNLDPGVMLAPFEVIAREARAILEDADGQPGHIFNLGHGVLPETPSDNLKRLAELVHEDTDRG
jgi:uroporphyrinogen decarboxylase